MTRRALRRFVIGLVSRLPMFCVAIRPSTSSIIRSRVPHDRRCQRLRPLMIWQSSRDVFGHLWCFSRKTARLCNWCTIWLRPFHAEIGEEEEIYEFSMPPQRHGVSQIKDRREKRDQEQYEW